MSRCAILLQVPSNNAAYGGSVCVTHLERDANRVLGKWKKAQEPFDEPSYTPGLPAIVLKARSPHNDAWAETKLGARVVDLHSAPIGQFINQAQERCLEIPQPRCVRVRPDVGDADCLRAKALQRKIS